MSRCYFQKGGFDESLDGINIGEIITMKPVDMKYLKHTYPETQESEFETIFEELGAGGVIEIKEVKLYPTEAEAKSKIGVPCALGVDMYVSKEYVPSHDDPDILITKYYLTVTYQGNPTPIDHMEVKGTKCGVSFCWGKIEPPTDDYIDPTGTLYGYYYLHFMNNSTGTAENMSCSARNTFSYTITYSDWTSMMKTQTKEFFKTTVEERTKIVPPD